MVVDCVVCWWHNDEQSLGRGSAPLQQRLRGQYCRRNEQNHCFLEHPRALDLVVPGASEALPLGFICLTKYPEAPALTVSSREEHEWLKHKREMKAEMITPSRPEVQN